MIIIKKCPLSRYNKAVNFSSIRLRYFSNSKSVIALKEEARDDESLASEERRKWPIAAGHRREI